MNEYHFSEQYGSFDCEYTNCSNKTYTIVLTDDECKKIQIQIGDYSFNPNNFILKNNLGTALCDECMEKIIKMKSRKEKIKNIKDGIECK